MLGRGTGGVGFVGVFNGMVSRDAARGAGGFSASIDARGKGGALLDNLEQVHTPFASAPAPLCPSASLPQRPPLPPPPPRGHPHSRTMRPACGPRSHRVWLSWHWQALRRRSQTPSQLLRAVIEGCTDYACALAGLSAPPLIDESYYIVAGSARRWKARPPSPRPPRPPRRAAHPAPPLRTPPRPLPAPGPRARATLRPRPTRLRPTRGSAFLGLSRATSSAAGAPPRLAAPRAWRRPPPRAPECRGGGSPR